MIPATLLSLLCILPAPCEPVRDRCDAIEQNFYYDEQGRLVFAQLIYYDFPPTAERHFVRAWRLVKDQSQVPQRDWRNGGYTSLFYEASQSGECWRLITAPSYYESWTQWDVELVEREYMPKEKRRELSGPRK